MDNYNFYDILAEHYDTMQSDMDVNAWARYISSLINKHAQVEGGVHTITDLGCGTGSVDIPLADEGYEVTGIDSAEEMLMQATMKDGAEQVIWTAQDITDFDLPESTDCFVSLLDTLDHITDEDALARLFERVQELLVPGGVFIFDVITEKHLSETLSDNIFYEDYEDFTLLWVNDYDADTATNTANLTLFELREDGELVEKFYPNSVIEACAAKTGLTKLALYGELSDCEPGEDAERVFFVFGKPEETK